jgi:hypothetical protein
MSSTALSLFSRKTQIVSFLANNGTSQVLATAQKLAHNVDALRISAGRPDPTALMEVARRTQALMAPAQAALQLARQTATASIVALLPDAFADEAARSSVRSGAQWGAKVGGYFGPIGTVVGVSLGAATSIGMRVLTYDAAQAVGVAASAPVVAGDLAGAPAQTVAVQLPQLKRAWTI